MLPILKEVVMSVICKTKEEMCIVQGGLLYHLDLYREVISSSELYGNILDIAGGYYRGYEEKLVEMFIGWLMFRLWVANKVAYSVQYHDSDVVLHEEIAQTEPLEIDLSFLSSELTSIVYNIYTNAGQCWFDSQWLSVLKSIQQCIKNSINSCAGGVK